MAIKKSKRLSVVLNLAQLKEDVAARQLGEVLGLVEQSKEQLKILDQYKLENQQHIRDKADSVSHGSQLFRQQVFLQQIGVAISEQDQRIKQMDQQLLHAKTNWQQLHYKRKAIGDHIEKIKLQEYMMTQKQEQKDSDDRPPKLLDN